MGSLSGVTNSTNLTSSSVTKAISSQASAVSATVKAGYMVRADADYNVRLPLFTRDSESTKHTQGVSKLSINFIVPSQAAGLVLSRYSKESEANCLIAWDGIFSTLVIHSDVLQTLEPRNNFTTRFSQVLAAGAHFVQTTFPTTPTLFPSTYTVSH